MALLAGALWYARNSEAATFQRIVIHAPKLVRPKATARASTRVEPTVTTSPGPLPSKLTRAANVIVWHPDAVEPDGSYDVIVHFHGVQMALEPAMREAGLRAVLIIINDGLVAESYRDGHGAPGTLTQLLDALHQHVAEAFRRDDVHARRVAVSAWSAGFGAVAPMLRRSDDVDRIDAVLVSDGVHSSFTDLRRRVIADHQLSSVVAFAKRAIARDKLFAITHTAIQTPDFASTTETAEKILGLLSITPSMILDKRPGQEPPPTSIAEQGDFVLMGFSGNDKHAHAVQQWALGRTLWARLAERWKS
ncbi:MAG TPA: hypothetical protein VKP30_21110 [Polyangiaceae bacterium]|nr:hypothetical protein [Polyangiaceae bacterium]